MLEKTGFIYIWYDRKRKMYYIGSHLGTIDDGYICSSRRMRDAYRRRPEDFRRRILKKEVKREFLLQEEHRWLSFIEKGQLGKKYYNLSTTTPTKYIPHNKQKHFEEIKQRMSEAAKNRDQAPYKNRMNVRHKITGWQGKINCDEYDKNIHEALVFRTDKKVTVIDEHGNSFGVTKEEFEKNRDMWKTHSSIFNKNKVVVLDKDGNKLKVIKGDPRIGVEYKIDDTIAKVSRGTIPVFTIEGKCIRVPKDHPKVLSGEYTIQCGVALKGRLCINNGKENKKIYPEDLSKYPGWTKGMLRHKKTNTKR